jgi:hypothetical protein
LPTGSGASPLFVRVDHSADLNLIFANPTGTPLKPDSISATVLRISKKAGLPMRASLRVLHHSYAGHLASSALVSRPFPNAWGTLRCGRPPTSTRAVRGRDRAALVWDPIQESKRT